MIDSGSTYHIAISEVDRQTERSTSESFGGDERIEESGFLARLDRPLVGQSREVLNVEVEIHRVAERGVERFENEVLGAVVLEADEELDEDAAG